MSSDINFNDFSPVWTKTALNDIKYVLKHTFIVLKIMGIDTFIMYGTLLGHKRHNKCPIPWDDDLDILADGDKLNQDDNIDLFRRMLSKHQISIVPFYGGYKIFLDTNVKKLNIEGYKHSWPFIDLFLYKSVTSRYFDSRIPGILVQGQPPWSTKNCKQQWWYKKEFIFPLRTEYFLGIEIYIPNNPTEILNLDYDKTHMDYVIATEWDHQNDCQTNYSQCLIKIELIKSFYKENGWIWEIVN